MKPSTIRREPIPSAEMMFRAIRRCSPHRSMPSARMNPPRYRKELSLKYDC
jgi:hypothetical protein